MVDGVEVAPIDYGRSTVQLFKQSLKQKIREAERDSVFDEFEGLKGELITGTVQRFEGGAVTVNLGKTEAILPRSEQIPGDDLHPGGRVRAIILDVRKVGQRVKIILSRTHPDFVRRLFELEIPEIADQIASIRALAREAGYRSKVSVTSIDPKVDAVGACVGVRGTRIKNIVDELGGERIDIVRWNEALQVLIPNALAPAEIDEVMLCNLLGRAIVLVREDQLSLAIGRRGQNVRLASKLVGWDIEIMTSEELDELIEKSVAGFTKIEGIDTELSERLVELGILSYDDLSVTEIVDLVNTIDGMSREKAITIVAKAEELAASQTEEPPRRLGANPDALTTSLPTKQTVSDGTMEVQKSVLHSRPVELPVFQGNYICNNSDIEDLVGTQTSTSNRTPFMRLSSPRRSFVQAKLAQILGNFVTERDLGQVFTDGPGLALGSETDTVRNAEVSYYGYDRLPKSRLSGDEITVIPNMVFEIRSPEDRWQRVLARVVAYLEAGVTLVVILDPASESVRIYSGDEPEKIQAVGDDITLEPVLAGFKIRAKALFS